jgi:hypothetical protein
VASTSTLPTAPKPTTTTIAAAPKPKKNPAIKAGLKGVVVTRKRARPEAKSTDDKTSSANTDGNAGQDTSTAGVPKKEKGKEDDNTEDGNDRKRRRVE